MPQPTNSVAMTLRLLRIIYFAFFASIPVYFVIGQVLGSKVPRAELTLLRNVLWLVGAANAVLAVAFRYRLMPALPPDEDPVPALPRVRGAYLASFALAESVAVLGLVLRMLGGTLHETLPFFAVAVVLFAILFPRLPDTYIG